MQELGRQGVAVGLFTSILGGFVGARSEVKEPSRAAVRRPAAPSGAPEPTY